MHCGHCKACGSCVDDCPGYILEMTATVDNSERPEVIYGDECWHCANCRPSCPTGAIGFRFPLRTQV
ncbi:MAG: ferredoxin family protein [Desulfovibrio sp.]|nr:ferredoxin family protein [Desulfovibrio sp.]